MKFPFFASFIVFCIWLGYELHKRRNLDAKADEEFWQKEAAANSTRRKPLDDLEYIQIPFDRLPMSLMAEDPQIMDWHNVLRELSASPIVNFTGISNTDLKLKYGAPNIDLLSRYDQCYTVLVRTLQDWANRLYREGYGDEACTILEFAIETRSDISATYKLLSEIYIGKKQFEKIEALLPVAETLNSSMKNHIVEILNSALSNTQS